MSAVEDVEAGGKLGQNADNPCSPRRRLWMVILVGGAVATSMLLVGYSAVDIGLPLTQPARDEQPSGVHPSELPLLRMEPEQLIRTKRWPSLDNITGALTHKDVNKATEEAEALIKKNEKQQQSSSSPSPPQQQGNSSAGAVNSGNGQPDEKKTAKEQSRMRKLWRKILKILKFWKWRKYWKDRKERKKKKKLEQAAKLLGQQQAQNGGNPNNGIK